MYTCSSDLSQSARLQHAIDKINADVARAKEVEMQWAERVEVMRSRQAQEHLDLRQKIWLETGASGPKDDAAVDSDERLLRQTQRHDKQLLNVRNCMLRCLQLARIHWFSTTSLHACACVCDACEC